MIGSDLRTSMTRRGLNKHIRRPGQRGARSTPNGPMGEWIYSLGAIFPVKRPLIHHNPRKDGHVAWKLASLLHPGGAVLLGGRPVFISAGLPGDRYANDPIWLSSPSVFWDHAMAHLVGVKVEDSAPLGAQGSACTIAPRFVRKWPMSERRQRLDFRRSIAPIWTNVDMPRRRVVHLGQG